MSRPLLLPFEDPRDRADKLLPAWPPPPLLEVHLAALSQVGVEVGVQSGRESRATNLLEFVELAGGAVGAYSYTRDLPTRPVAIHATHDKAHTVGGYQRFTADGNLISETRSVGIRVYKAGQWGSAGSLGQVTHHDRSNSIG